MWENCNCNISKRDIWDLQENALLPELLLLLQVLELLRVVSADTMRRVAAPRIQGAMRAVTGHGYPASLLPSSYLTDLL